MNERGEHQTQPPLDVVVNDVRQFADRPEVKASERLNTPTQRVLEIITGKKQDSVTQENVDELTRIQDQVRGIIIMGGVNGKEEVYKDLLLLVNRAIQEMAHLLTRQKTESAQREKDEKNKLPGVFERTTKLNDQLESTLDGMENATEQIRIGAPNIDEVVLNLTRAFSQAHEIDRLIGDLLKEIDDFLAVFNQVTSESVEARFEKTRTYNQIRDRLVKLRERSFNLWRENYHLVVPSLNSLREFFNTAEERVTVQHEDPNTILEQLAEAVDIAQNDPLVSEHSGRFGDTLQEQYFQRAAELRRSLIEHWNNWLMSPANPNTAYVQAQTLLEDYRTRFINGNEDFTAAQTAELNAMIARLEAGRDGFTEPEQRDFINSRLINPLRNFPDAVKNKKDADKDRKRRELENYPRALKNIIDYLEGMGPLHGHPEWAEGGWKKAKASEMARAIFAIAMQHIDHVGFSGHKLYIGPLNLINISIQELDDHPKMGEGILNGFKALATYFDQLADSGLDDVNVELARANAKQIPGLAGQLANDLVEIDRILKFGSNVKGSLNDIDRIIGTVFAAGEAKEQNAFDHQNITRTFEIGQGYLEEEDRAELVALYKRIGRALQNVFAVNEPINHEEAVYSAPDEHGHTIFLRNVNETNPLGWFPEERTDGYQSDLRIIKRVLVQITAGQTDSPVWQRGNDYEVRMQLARDDFRMKLFGDPAAGFSEKNPDPNSLWGRYRSDADPQKLVNLGFLTTEEKKARSEGRLAETLASNIFMAGLEGGKASGSKMKRDSQGNLITENIGGVEYPVVDASTGVLGENQLDRLINPIYRRKTKTQGGGEGSSGPVISVDWVYSTVQTFFDRYALAEPGQMVGHTLKEKIMLCNDDTFQDVKWSDFIQGGVEEKTVWPKGVDTGARYYKTLIKRMGIHWNSIIKKAAHGLPGEYDYNALEMLGGWSREIYYLLTRDYGAIVNKWENDEDYARFKEVENIYDQQMQTGDSSFPADPNVLTPPITRKEWEQVIKLNVLPTSKHVIYDARPVKDEEGKQAGKGMARFVTNIHHNYRIAAYLPPEAHLNSFEEEVFKNMEDGRWDAYLQMKKVILGFLIMNDISVNSFGMTYDDASAIVEFLSYERWSRRHENAIMERVHAITQSPHPEYNGIGIFSEAEAFALLHTANVNTGIFSRFQAYTERAKALPFIGGGHH